MADWEHVMIRFIDEQPQSVYMSQHDEGEAVDYASMLKTENRPTVYVAKGGHGNYPLVTSLACCLDNPGLTV